MKKLISVLFIVTLLPIGQTWAGAGHSHGPGGSHSHGPVSSDKVTERALKKVQQLVNRGKVDSSWANIKKAEVEKKTFANGPEWVVSLVNSKVKDNSKQTLYLFYTLDGHYIAANYNGK